MACLSAGNQRDQDLWYRYAEMAKWNLIQLKQHKKKNKTYLINLHSQAKKTLRSLTAEMFLNLLSVLVRFKRFSTLHPYSMQADI